MKTYDKIIIGAGLYGLYSALFCGRRGQRVLVLEYDNDAFSRATYINQARVHNGYHYPRSLSTAVKSAYYFERFANDFSFCIHKKFEKIYAVAARHSWTGAQDFIRFCKNAKIDCIPVAPEGFFTPNMCESAFITTEFTYDALLLKEYFISEISKLHNVNIVFGARINSIMNIGKSFTVFEGSSYSYQTEFIINSTYASVNQILNMLGITPFPIKYELCEIILCNVNDNLKGVGITVMDGPFFSIMPFGQSGYHSLTSVCFTPHQVCNDLLPHFKCQNDVNSCSELQLGNCNECSRKPGSAWPYMSALARKFLKKEYAFTYKKSLFSMKPILKASEIDDSRPTVIVNHSEAPKFISVLSGKINTVYDLDEYLND